MIDILTAIALYENKSLYISVLGINTYIVFSSGESVNITKLPFTEAKQILIDYNIEQTNLKQKTIDDVKQKVVDTFGIDALAVFKFEDVLPDYGVTLIFNDIWFSGTIISETVRDKIAALKKSGELNELHIKKD